MSQLVGYLESVKFSDESYVSRFFEYILGENGKNVSLVDALITLASAAGLTVIYSHPYVGVPLVVIGTSSLTYRRGAKASFIAPLAVYTAVKRPDLVIGIVKEGTETLGEAARGAVQLGFQVTGLIVTTAGAVVGYVFANKKKSNK